MLEVAGGLRCVEMTIVRIPFGRSRLDKISRHATGGEHSPSCPIMSPYSPFESEAPDARTVGF